MSQSSSNGEFFSGSGNSCEPCPVEVNTSTVEKVDLADPAPIQVEQVRDVEQGTSPLDASGSKKSATLATAAAADASGTSCCLVCLEEWQVGDRVCQSAGCRHVFHQTCIVSWLVVVNHHRTTAHCPTCRQAFLPSVPHKKSSSRMFALPPSHDQDAQAEA